MHLKSSMNFKMVLNYRSVLNSFQAILNKDDLTIMDFPEGNFDH